VGKTAKSTKGEEGCGCRSKSNSEADTDEEENAQVVMR
jgi:hypothetical protein